MRYVFALLLALASCNSSAPTPSSASQSDASADAMKTITVKKARQRGPGEIQSGKVIFVVSNGGSMLPYFDEAKSELQNAVVGLRPEQDFNVIFSNWDATAAFNATHAVPATPENKEDCLSFIGNIVIGNIVSDRESNITDALTVAVSMKPDLIWVISNGDPNDYLSNSDGWDPEFIATKNRKIEKVKNDALRLAERCGDEGPTRINTVLNYAVASLEWEQMLFDLAYASGGICLDPDGKIVSSRPTTLIVKTPEPRPPVVLPATVPTIFKDR